MRRLRCLALCAMFLAGCHEARDDDDLRPGTVAQIVSWHAPWRATPSQVATLTRETANITLQPGTTVVVIRRGATYKNRYNRKVAWAWVRVLDGPDKGAEGTLPCPHLLDTGKMVEIEPSVPAAPAPPPAKS